MVRFICIGISSLVDRRVHISEVCHPPCAFKLYGEVNSVKKHNYKIWLNDGVY